jgi:hypothetical protein
MAPFMNLTTTVLKQIPEIDLVVFVATGGLKVQYADGKRLVFKIFACKLVKCFPICFLFYILTVFIVLSRIIDKHQ